MNKRRLILRLFFSMKNVKFNDFVTILTAYGFTLERVEGSHHIYKNPSVSEQMNVQNKNDEAKPYQIKQFLRLVEKYELRLYDTEENTDDA